jgi:hypothetical protein
MEIDMQDHPVRFVFARSVPMDEVEGTLQLARIATEILHGVDRVRLEARFSITRDTRTCVIDTSSEAGRTLALIFAGYVGREFGADAVKTTRSRPELPAAEVAP